MPRLITHWRLGTYIYILVNWIINGSGNGLSPARCQAITSTNADSLLIKPLGTNFSETLFEIQLFSFRWMHLKILSGKFQPFCSGLTMITKASLYLAVLFWSGCGQYVTFMLHNNMLLPTCIWNISLIRLRLRQNGKHFADNIFKCISLYEYCCIFWFKILSIKFFVPKVSINNKPVSSDKDLAQNRRQAIMWINDGLFHWCINSMSYQDYFIMNFPHRRH